MWALLWPILQKALVSAAVGGGISKATGGKFKDGALMGGLGSLGGGLVGGAFSKLLGGSAAKAAGAAAGASAGTSGGGLASGAGGLASKVAPTALTSVAKPATSGFSNLLSATGKAAATGAGTALGTGALQAALPSTSMSIPGDVPQMPINDDTMAMLEKLMAESKRKGINTVM